jgi:hypothetical protein
MSAIESLHSIASATHCPTSLLSLPLAKAEPYISQRSIFYLPKEAKQDCRKTGISPLNI